MPWEVVATGARIQDLELIIADRELAKGQKLKVEMESWVSWIFDLPGAELVFQPLMPEGVTLIDVYAERGKGIVDMEVDPAWLSAIISFIKTHWWAALLAGFVLGVIVTKIEVLIFEKIPDWGWVVLGSVGIITAGSVVYLLTRPKVGK